VSLHQPSKRAKHPSNGTTYGCCSVRSLRVCSRSFEPQALWARIALGSCVEAFRIAFVRRAGASSVVLASRAGASRMAIFVLIACLAIVLTACSSQPQISVRESVNEYTWSELSTISDEIAAAPDDAAALEIA